MSIRLQQVDFSLSGWTLSTAQAQNEEDGKGGDAKILSTPLEKLTTEVINGTGAFDVLMRAAKGHMVEEYDAGRITGADYTQVYLGALSAVLQTSIQFLLNEQQAQKINADIGLVRQQTVTELAQTDDNIPVGLGFNHTPLVITPIPPVDFPGGTL